MRKFKRHPKNRIAMWLLLVLLILLSIIIIWQFTSYSTSNKFLASLGLPLAGGAGFYLIREIASRFAGDSTIDAPPPGKKKKDSSKKPYVHLTEEELKEIIKKRRQK